MIVNVIAESDNHHDGIFFYRMDSYSVSYSSYNYGNFHRKTEKIRNIDKKLTENIRFMF